MKRTRRIAILMLLMVIVLAIPATVAARKQLYKARLDGTSSGSAVVALRPGGVDFMLSARGLSEQPWGAHIHGPDGNIIVNLCGNPKPTAVENCTTEDGILKVMGSFSGPDVQGMTNAEFLSALQNGELYINVHTSSGVEATGHLYLH